MTSYPQTLTVKKLIKMGFLLQRYITFLLRMTQILHIPKIIFVALLIKEQFSLLNDGYDGAFQLF